MIIVCARRVKPKIDISDNVDPPGKIINGCGTGIDEMSFVKILEFLKSLSLWEKVVAGLIVVIIVGVFTFSRKKIIHWWYKRKIYEWLKANTTDQAWKQFKSTQEISKATGINENVVRSICTKHKNIYAHKKNDEWSIFRRDAKSIYEERGILTLGSD